MASPPDLSDPAEIAQPPIILALDERLRQRLLVYQRNEITEHHFYRRMARLAGPANRQVLERIANCELDHYRVWQGLTGALAGLTLALQQTRLIAILVLPFLLLPNAFVALGITLAVAVLTIAIFNFFLAIAMDEPFLRRFFEMTVLNLGIASITFLIGYVIRATLDIDIG